MEFGKIGNFYAIRMPGGEFIDQTGRVHYKDKEPDIRIVESVDIPQDIRSALESVFLADKEYNELYEKIEETNKAKKDAIESLWDLSKESLCTIEEFLNEFYNNIPNDIRNKYFGKIVKNNGFIPSCYNDNLYHVESNFSTNLISHWYLEIYLKRYTYVSDDKNTVNTLKEIIKYSAIDSIPTYIAEDLKKIEELLKVVHYPLPTSSNNFNEYITIPDYTNKIAVCSMYKIPVTEKYLTREYACRLAKEFFDA